MSFPDLSDYLPRQDTCEDVSLYGQRVAERGIRFAAIHACRKRKIAGEIVAQPVD